MKILHIYSEWKWTGPAEPILNLCLGLSKSGHTIFLACQKPPDDFSGRTLPSVARENGLEPILLTRPSKFTGILAILKNIKRIRAFLQSQPIDIIHTHSVLDHFIGGKAARKISPFPLIIRTNHKGIPLKPTLYNRFLLKHYTDGYITLSEGLLNNDRASFQIPAEQSWYVNGAVDPGRFRAEAIRKDIRAELGINDNDTVAGIVARIQRHRRFDVLLQAIALVIKELPHFKVVIIGRGTHQEKLARRPSREMGLDKNIVFAGYRTDDYVDTIAALDFGIYLVPGSDGSCRAVREMMILGKPMIVADRGILPDIVQDGITGLVVKDTVKNLARAIKQMAQDAGLRIQWGTAARTKALKDFSLNEQTRRIEEIYQRVLGGRKDG